MAGTPVNDPPMAGTPVQTPPGAAPLSGPNGLRSVRSNLTPNLAAEGFGGLIDLGTDLPSLHRWRTARRESFGDPLPLTTAGTVDPGQSLEVARLDHDHGGADIEARLADLESRMAAAEADINDLQHP